MLPNLLSLAILVRTIELGSLSKAAQDLNIAVAAASRRISILEARYKVPLLVRSAHGVKSTAAGEALLPHARQMLEQASEISLHLKLFAEGVRGHIRLEAITTAITQYLPSDLTRFFELFPDVRVDLAEARSGDIIERLRSGAIDIGIVVEGTDMEGLVTHEYRRDRLVVIVPRLHPIHKRRIRFSELLEHDVVGLDDSATLTQLLFKAALACGEPLRMRVQVRSLEAVYKLVQAGMGFAVIPEVAARTYVKAMGLRLIHLEEPWSERLLHVSIHQARHLPPEAWKLVAQLVGPDGLRQLRRPG